MTKKNDLNEKTVDKVSGGYRIDDIKFTAVEDWFYTNQRTIEARAIEAGVGPIYGDFIRGVLDSDSGLNMFKSVEGFKSYLKEKLGINCDDLYV